MKINLSDKVASNLIVSEPSKEKILENWQKYIATSKIIDPYVEGEKRKAEQKKKAKQKRKNPPRRKIRPLRKITKCGCGKHPVNSKGDVYKQHNQWMAQQMNRIEEGDSKLRGVKGTGASIKKFEPTYDFSGEDFEMSPEELRRTKIKND